MDIAEKIERGMTIECYGIFGSRDFCKKCPISCHCKKSTHDDIMLHSYGSTLDKMPAYEVDQSAKKNRSVITSDSDRAVMSVLTLIFTLTEKQFSILRARFRFPWEDSVEQAKRLNIGRTQTLFCHYRKIIKKIPQLSEILFFSKVGKQRKHVGKRKKYPPVICIETGEVFLSTTQAAKEKGTNHSSIIRSCRTGYRAGGFHWRFAKKTMNEE